MYCYLFGCELKCEEDWETILVVVIVTFLVPCPPVTAACRQSWAGNVFGYEFNFCAGFLFNLMSKSNSAKLGGGRFNFDSYIKCLGGHTDSRPRSTFKAFVSSLLTYPLSPLLSVQTRKLSSSGMEEGVAAKTKYWRQSV